MQPVSAEENDAHFDVNSTNAMNAAAHFTVLQTPDLS